MLAQRRIENNEEVILYQVPQNKSALVEIIIFSPTSNTITCKINDLVLFQLTTVGQISQKLLLTSNDTIKIGTTGEVNVFISGKEV